MWPGDRLLKTLVGKGWTMTAGKRVGDLPRKLRPQGLPYRSLESLKTTPPSSEGPLNAAGAGADTGVGQHKDSSSWASEEPWYPEQRHGRGDTAASPHQVDSWVKEP